MRVRWMKLGVLVWVAVAAVVARAADAPAPPLLRGSETASGVPDASVTTPATKPAKPRRAVRTQETPPSPQAQSTTVEPSEAIQVAPYDAADPGDASVAQGPRAPGAGSGLPANFLRRDATPFGRDAGSDALVASTLRRAGTQPRQVYRTPVVSGGGLLRGMAHAVKPPSRAADTQMPIKIFSWLVIGACTLVLARMFLRHLRRAKRQASTL